MRLVQRGVRVAFDSVFNGVLNIVGKALIAVVSVDDRGLGAAIGGKS